LLFTNSERKRRPKERELKLSFLKEENQMARVTYRGCQYDTEHRRQAQAQQQQQPQQYNETYRGVKFVKEFRQ
jgi:predicted adenine nucleotide alpha hydrolase (AANH) superfamily ATPase